MMRTLVARRRLLLVLLTVVVCTLISYAIAFVSLARSPEALILRLKVQNERPLGSRLLIPDFLFSVYWHTLGEQRLEQTAAHDPVFVKVATGLWIEAFGNSDLNYAEANKLLSTYICALAEKPEGAAGLRRLIEKYPQQEKWRLQMAACAKTPAR